MVCRGDVQVGMDEAVSEMAEKPVGEQLELSRALSIGDEYAESRSSVMSEYGDTGM